MIKPELYFRLHKEREMLADGKRHVVTVEDADVIHELIEAVPDSWGHKGWLDGELHAPSRLLRDGGAVRGLWLELGDFSGGYPFALSISDRTRVGVYPDIASMLIRKRHPGCIRFDKAGRTELNKHVSFETARQLACYYVLRGYRGRLAFMSGGYKGDLSKNPLCVDMRLEVWEGNYPEAGQQQPRIRMRWNESLGGSRGDLETLEHVCRKHGLPEYELIGAADYYRQFETQLQFWFERPLAVPKLEPVPYAVAAE